MSNYVKLATEASDSYFAALNDTQETFLRSFAAFRGWMPAMSPPQARELPTQEEIVEASFSFAQKLLKQQQEFVEKIIAASTGPVNASASPGDLGMPFAPPGAAPKSAPARGKSAAAS
jgi:hypothetical protein